MASFEYILGYTSVGNMHTGLRSFSSVESYISTGCGVKMYVFCENINKKNKSLADIWKF